MLTKLFCVIALSLTVCACSPAEPKPPEVCVLGTGASTNPPPTVVCDGSNEGELMCNNGCGWRCSGGCWNFGCDGPCGGLDAGF